MRWVVRAVQQLGRIWVATTYQVLLLSIMTDFVFGNVEGTFITYDSSTDPVDDYSSEKGFATVIDHPNYLRVKFIDPQSNRIVHERYEQTFKAYVESLGDAVKDYTLLSVENCPKMSYKAVVSEKLKQIIHNLLDFVFDMHAVGKCLSKFTEDNLVVSKSHVFQFDEDDLEYIQKWSVKFWKLSFVDFTMTGRARDVVCVQKIIANLFSSQNSTPYDVQHFLGKLSHDVDATEWESREFYLRHHIAILTIKDRLFLMRSFHEKLHFMLKLKLRKDYMTAVAKLNGTLSCDWRQQFENKALGPMKECFNFKPKGEEQKSSKMDKKDTPYAADGSLYDLGIFRCMTTHLPEFIQKFKDYDQDSYSVRANPKFRMDVELDVCMMHLFRQELLQFQWELHSVGILEEFYR